MGRGPLTFTDRLWMTFLLALTVVWVALLTRLVLAVAHLL